MARIRKIKPEFWDDEHLGELEPIVRLLFIGLWTHADARGIVPASERWLKAKVFPYDDFTASDVAGWVMRLCQDRGDGRSFVERFEVGGKEYLLVRNFPKHQKHPTREWDQLKRAQDEGRAHPEPPNAPPGGWPWASRMADPGSGKDDTAPSPQRSQVVPGNTPGSSREHPNPTPRGEGVRSKEKGVRSKDHGGTPGTRFPGEAPPNERRAKEICKRLHDLHTSHPDSFAQCPPTIASLDAIELALGDRGTAETVEDALAQLESHGPPPFWSRGRLGLSALLKHAPKIARGEWHGGNQGQAPPGRTFTDEMRETVEMLQEIEREDSSNG